MLPPTTPAHEPFRTRVLSRISGRQRNRDDQGIIRAALTNRAPKTDSSNRPAFAPSEHRAPAGRTRDRTRPMPLKYQKVPAETQLNTGDLRTFVARLNLPLFHLSSLDRHAVAVMAVSSPQVRCEEVSGSNFVAVRRQSSSNALMAGAMRPCSSATLSLPKKRVSLATRGASRASSVFGKSTVATSLMGPLRISRSAST
jgi:hypothetical protein